MGFDIEGLLDFEPASGRCVKCLALLQNPGRAAGHACPVCGLIATPSPSFTTAGTTWTNGSFVGTNLPLQYGYGYSLSASSSPPFMLPVTFSGDPIEHAKGLALLARLLRSQSDQAPLHILASCLLRARSFVHFTTWNISHTILGLLAAVSEFVPVSGIASGVDKNTGTEISRLRQDFARLDVRPVVKTGDNRDLIHTKLIVIDGLLAISGSPNLTTESWRKTAVNKERLDIVTDVTKVVEDNNRYFSGHWAELNTDFDVSAYSGSGWLLYEGEQPAESGSHAIEQ